MPHKGFTVRLMAYGGLALAFYFGAFHGQMRSSSYADGTRFTSTQYFLVWRMWEQKWTAPPRLPDEPPDKNAVMGKGQDWRGFGLIWKKTRHFR